MREENLTPPTGLLGYALKFRIGGRSTPLPCCYSAVFVNAITPISCAVSNRMTFSAHKFQVFKRQGYAWIIDVVGRQWDFVVYNFPGVILSDSKADLTQSANAGSIGAPAPLPRFTLVELFRPWLHINSSNNAKRGQHTNNGCTGLLGLGQITIYKLTGVYHAISRRSTAPSVFLWSCSFVNTSPENIEIYARQNLIFSRTFPEINKKRPAHQQWLYWPPRARTKSRYSLHHIFGTIGLPQ